ncbi:MAG: oligosaccharide flippase family protein [Sandaracinus sp.]|nr:oligosaccharide flippase family protein [Sandaracinus sp.]MCB9616845.1 oligosaccharide flippase family protein [Sandaracinus sp.]MCB9634261.1 oligosaccharide flippase family protein [Sandaracinus sp.]
MGSDDATSENKPKVGRLAARGSVFELGGYLATYVLRFVSSAVLRSLLFPAAFGLMEVINGISIGLIMLSDVGIQQAIIQSPRGDEQRFLDTAFTMHVVRGLGLWVVALVLAYPAAWVTDSPELATLIPVATLGNVVLGFQSTSEYTLRRRMMLGRIIGIEVFCQLMALGTTITWASLSPSVWALIAGGLVNVTFRVALSHWLAGVVGYRNRFAWDAGVRKEIFEFGKWITGSSAVDFMSMWGDRLLLVGLLGTSVSGVYATAVLIAETFSGALNRVVHGVFYPLFSRVAREDFSALQGVYYQARKRFDVLSMTATGGLSALGPWVIEFLFDSRYVDAGWILRILCVRSAFQCVLAPCETCITALGHTRFGFYQNLARAIWVAAGVPIGFWLGGVVGVVWVVAFAGVPPMLVLWPKFAKLGLLRLDRELFAWGLFAFGAAIGFGVDYLLPEAAELRGAIKEWVAG